MSCWSPDEFSSTVVYKLGGSLLRRPDLRELLHQELASLAPKILPLVVVGGGSHADQVRRWQSLYGISDETAHWLAIHAMRDNADQLQRLWPHFRLVADRDHADSCWRDRRIPLLDPLKFVESTIAGPPGEDAFRKSESGSNWIPFSELPPDWTTTSDAIAGWIARVWPAPTLHLLKSCRPAAQDLPGLCQHQQIDPVLPAVLQGTGIEVFWNDLSDQTGGPVKLAQLHRTV